MKRNIEFKEELFSNKKRATDSLFDIHSDTLESHVAEAPHGLHQENATVKEQAKEVAIQHAVGDQQNARDRGYERGQNDAINTTATGADETVFHNSETIPTSAPSQIPIDIDAIEIDGKVTHPQDTQTALPVA